MKVRVTQLDGKLPNLALMRLAAWHRHEGDEVFWERGTSKQLHEPDYDVVYGSAIFTTSEKAIAQLRLQFPGAIVGGYGADRELRVEDVVPSQFVGLDYSGYPRFDASIGYAMRGCRFKCRFCPVPVMEGRPRANHAIAQIYRGDPWPRHLHLLDNDFFGNPQWSDVVAAIRDGGFKVCINQGVNVRLLIDEQAEALASLELRDDQFNRRRLYTAWDQIGDERVVMAGLDRLDRAGLSGDAIMVYMLVGYDPRETWERIWHRYNRLLERGVRPYPMVHDRHRLTDPEHWRKLKRLQSWAVSPAQGACRFEDFRPDHKAPPTPGPLLEPMGVE